MSRHRDVQTPFGRYQDLKIPVTLHRFLAGRAGSKGTRDVPGASHALSVSRPDAVAATILDAVAAL